MLHSFKFVITKATTASPNYWLVTSNHLVSKLKWFPCQGQDASIVCSQLFYGLQYFGLKQLPLIRVKIFFEEKISLTFGQNKGTNDLVLKKKNGKNKWTEVQVTLKCTRNAWIAENLGKQFYNPEKFIQFIMAPFSESFGKNHYWSYPSQSWKLSSLWSRRINPVIKFSSRSV